MKLTTSAVASPIAAGAAPQTIELRAGDDLPATMADTPVGRLLSRHYRDYLSLPGATSLTWQPSAGDWLEVNFRTEAQRAIGERILEPTVSGVAVRAAQTTWANGSKLPDNSLMAYMDALNAIDNLPGVFYHRTQASQPDQDGMAVFSVVSDATVKHLDPIVRDWFNGPTRDDGSIKKFEVRWIVPQLPPATV